MVKGFKRGLTPWIRSVPLHSLSLGQYWQHWQQPLSLCSSPAITEPLGF